MPQSTAFTVFKVCLSLIWAVFFVIGCVMFIMSPMMFDAPGSTKNPVVIVAFLAAATLSINCVIAICCLLGCKNPNLAMLFGLLPLVNLLVFGAILIFTGKHNA